jgi:hypothetical protein
MVTLPDRREGADAACNQPKLKIFADIVNYSGLSPKYPHPLSGLRGTDRRAESAENLQEISERITCEQVPTCFPRLRRENSINPIRRGCAGESVGHFRMKLDGERFP